MTRQARVVVIVAALVVGLGAGWLVWGREASRSAVRLGALEAELEIAQRERKRAESMPSAVQMAQAMRSRCPKTPAEGARGGAVAAAPVDAGAGHDGGGSLDGEDVTMAAAAMKLAGATVRQKVIDDVKLSDRQVADLDAAAAAMNKRVQAAIDRLFEAARSGEPKTRDLVAATIDGLSAIQAADQAYLGLLDGTQKEKGSAFDVATQIDPVPLLDRLRKVDGIFGGGAGGAEPGKHQITIGAEIKTNEPAGK